MSSADQTLQELGERIVYGDQHERLRKATWLRSVGEFDARDGSLRWGCSSTASWLEFQCQMDARTARDHVRVARRLRELPLVEEAFALGQLSYCKVRALARADAEEDERELVRVAYTSTVRQLERHVRQLRSAASADVDVAERTRRERHFTAFWAGDGSLRYFGRMPADQGAALIEAIETRAALIGDDDRGPCCSQEFKRPPIGARRVDALVELVTGGGGQTQLVLHADPEALACTARGDEPRRGEILHLEHGPAIPSELARRLTCEAMITVHGLNHGRTIRLGTHTQRRALERRDGRRCSWPGCERTHGLQIHHLDHWTRGGKTDLVNLGLYCTFHHHLAHEGGWTIKRNRGGTVIRDPDGKPVHDIPSRASPQHRAAA